MQTPSDLVDSHKTKSDSERTLPGISDKLARAFFGFCFFSLVIAICHALVTFNTYRRISEGHLEQLINAASVPALMSIKYLDYTVAEEVVKSLHESPYIRQAKILDEFSNLLGKTNLRDEVDSSLVLQVFGLDQFEQRSMPLAISPKAVGQLKLHIDHYAILVPFLGDVLITLELAFFLCLLAGLYLYYSTSYPFRKGLIALLDWVNARRTQATLQRLPAEKAEYAEILHFADEIQIIMMQLQKQLNFNQLQQKQLAQQANEDVLTGLGNRRALEELFKHTNFQGIVHLIFMDVDEFKRINDHWNYQLGDRVLSHLGSLLKAMCLSLESHFFEVHAVRFGGDEFLLLAFQRTQDENLGPLVHLHAQKMLTDFGDTFNYRGRDSDSLSLSITIALASLPVSGTALEQHFHHVNAAMANFKKEQRNTIHEINALTISSVSRQIEINRGINEAIDHNQLYFCFQPIYGATDLTVVGFEALLRWNHPQLGKIAPDDFVAMIEEGSLCAQATRAVVKLFFEGVADFTKQAWFEHSWRFSLNLSHSQLASEGLLDLLSEQASLHQVPLTVVDIEITERQINRFPNLSEKLLIQAHQLGIQISLDDFGSGYAAWDGILNLPVDRVKIDKSLLNSREAADSINLVGHLISACRALGLKTVCEGIESQRELDIATSAGGDSLQGYHLCRPQKIQQLINRIEWRQLEVSQTMEHSYQTIGETPQHAIFQS